MSKQASETFGDPFTGDPSMGDTSMQELFRQEVESQSAILTEGLLGLEQDANSAQRLKELMRSSHSLKGAARIVGRDVAVRIAHGMEDCLVAVQKNKQSFSPNSIDTLLAGVDLLNRHSRIADEDLPVWESTQRNELETYLLSLSALAQVLSQSGAETVALPASPAPVAIAEVSPIVSPIASSTADRVLRVTADNLDRLMGLAGEALLASRWAGTFSADLCQLERLEGQFTRAFDAVEQAIPALRVNERTSRQWTGLRALAADFQKRLSARLLDLDLFDRRFAGFSQRLYHEVLDCRMRPFADGIQGFQRMVRDVSRSLGKNVRFEIKGETTPVDREILERLTAPLDQLIRNALDHGVESASVRQASGKQPQGVIELHACHSAGMLLISLRDDGRGIDSEAIRHTVISRKLTTEEATHKMTRAELLEFLFLPGFTVKESVSEISGRGVGLDVVQTMVKEVGGRVRISSQPGEGTHFQLDLPITLSVVRTLLIEIGNEPYALPLARIDRALKLPEEQIEMLQGRQHFLLAGEYIGLVAAHQILELDQGQPSAGEISVVVLGDQFARYGLVIDRFLGERDLVVRTLDPRLGKLRNISSAALMPDGSPVLIIDVDDLIRSIENLVTGQRLFRTPSAAGLEVSKKQKRVLVVEDSLTARELERKLLASRGYAVDVAVDGMDGWNAVRTAHYDLLLTDVDMPRMDGIELLKLIRKDSRLKTLPVMIVSYKDREEDRKRGLEAGADYYLTKASFHDETLARIVADLIGEAQS